MTWFWLVIFYSFGGYLLEKGYAAAVRSPHRVRKCFLLLPLCPVYGLAMLAAGHQLTGILGGINPILHANQIDAEILHDLQGGQHICRISAEAGQLEHQHEGYTIFPGFYILHHAVELASALNRFTRLTGVLIFTDYLIIIVLGKGFHSGLLGIQRVSVNLHGGGYSRIDIYFCLFFFHLTILIRATAMAPLCILTPKFFRSKFGHLSHDYYIMPF